MVEFSCQCRRCKRCRLEPWVEKILWRRKRQPSPVFLPGKFHGQRSLAGYSPWGGKESDTTEHNHSPACNLIIGYNEHILYIFVINLEVNGFSWLLWAVLENESNPDWLLASVSETQVTMWTWDKHLSGRRFCGIESFTIESASTLGEAASELSGFWDSLWMSENCCWCGKAYTYTHIHTHTTQFHTHVGIGSRSSFTRLMEPFQMLWGIQKDMEHDV